MVSWFSYVFMIPPPAKNRIRKGNIASSRIQFSPIKNHKSILYIHIYTYIIYIYHTDIHVHVMYMYMCMTWNIYTYYISITLLYYIICPLYIYIYIHVNSFHSTETQDISPAGSEFGPRKATLDLASLYAFCWQSLERAERSMDSERLLCVAQMLCRSVKLPHRLLKEAENFRLFVFFWDFLENHRVYAELWRRIWNIPHNDWLGYNGINIWIETIVACMSIKSVIHDSSIW